MNYPDLLKNIIFYHVQDVLLQWIHLVMEELKWTYD